MSLALHSCGESEHTRQNHRKMSKNATSVSLSTQLPVLNKTPLIFQATTRTVHAGSDGTEIASALFIAFPQLPTDI